MTILDPLPEQQTSQVLPSGRRIYRHESGQGSVIEFNYWGVPMKLFVADAKYRGLGLRYDIKPRAHGNPQLKVTTSPLNGGSNDNDTMALPYTRDDAWIQSTYPELKGDGTAESNTDKLVVYPTTEAAHHCRNQDIPGVGQLDLPNLYELIILYLESDNIDALDPTVTSNRDKALGKMNTYGRFDFNDQGLVWSSTESIDDYGWRVTCFGVTHYYTYNAIHLGVIPVKEL